MHKTAAIELHEILNDFNGDGPVEMAKYLDMLAQTGACIILNNEQVDIGVQSKRVKLPQTQGDKDVLSQYLCELEKMKKPALSNEAEHEKELVVFESGDTEEINKIIEDTLFIVPSIAQLYVENLTTDILQEANLAVVEAAKAFNPKIYKTSFRIYAAFFARRAILEMIVKQDESIIFLKRCERVKDTADSMKLQGKAATAELIAKETGFTTDFVELVLQDLNQTNSNATVADKQKSSTIMRVKRKRADKEGKTKKPETTRKKESMEKKEKAENNQEAKNAPAISSDIENLMRTLSQEEQTVIDGFFGLSGEALDAEAIAMKLNISIDEVMQIKNAALMKMRAN